LAFQKKNVCPTGGIRVPSVTVSSSTNDLSNATVTMKQWIPVTAASTRISTMKVSRGPTVDVLGEKATVPASACAAAHKQSTMPIQAITIIRLRCVLCRLTYPPGVLGSNLPYGFILPGHRRRHRCPGRMRFLFQ
jgi:hypothetical protein